VSDPEEQARHLAAAATGPDERIARALERGAAVARLRGAWESAAELLERAYKLTPSDRIDEASRRRIAAAEHHVHAGDRTHARQLLERILGQRLARPLRADALRLLAEISFNDKNAAHTGRLSRRRSATPMSRG
jgi:Tfp pilus assembly protein PilF